METRYYYPGRVYESVKGRFPRFVDAVPEKLTVRRDPVFLFRTYRRDPKPPYTGIHETVFHEVRKVPVRELYTPEINALISEPIKRKPVSSEAFIKVMFNTLTKIIEDYWIPEKFHIAHHSAGFDSRLISTVIKKLYEKNGPEWLGDIVFIEINFEDKWFERIMQIEGWDNSQYIVYNGEAEPKEKHSRSFEFRTAWEKLGGVSCFPWNYWWDPIDWLQEQGIAPDDSELQCFSGLGSAPKYSFHVRGQGVIDQFLRERYSCCCYTMPLKGDWMMPFLSLEYIRKLIEYGEGQTGFYRKAVLDYFAPELDEVKHAQAGFGGLSPRLYDQVKRDYLSSWYGREVRPDMENLHVTHGIGYGIWWGYWCLASFCDHLLETGHEIKIDS